MRDYETGFGVGQVDRRGGIDLSSRVKVAEWDTHDEEWKRGWSDGYEQG